MHGRESIKVENQSLTEMYGVPNRYQNEGGVVVSHESSGFEIFSFICVC